MQHRPQKHQLPESSFLIPRSSWRTCRDMLRCRVLFSVWIVLLSSHCQVLYLYLLEPLINSPMQDSLLWMLERQLVRQLVSQAHIWEHSGSYYELLWFGKNQKDALHILELLLLFHHDVKKHQFEYHLRWLERVDQFLCVLERARKSLLRSLIPSQWSDN